MRNRTYSVIMLMLLSLTMAVSACKRGEDDPGLTFSSRDGRLIGQWVLKLVSTSDTDFDNTNAQNTVITTEIFDGTTWTTTVDGTVTDTDSYALELTINKDGTAYAVETRNGRIREETGDWFWANSAKNKTEVVLPFPTLRWFDMGLYHVRELRKKTLVLTIDQSEKDTDTNGDITETTINETWTFEAK